MQKRKSTNVGTIVIHTDKKTGVKYAYSKTKTQWDKDKKGPRNRQTYLGVWDDVNGEVIETDRTRKKEEKMERALFPDGAAAITRVSGPASILAAIDSDIGVSTLVAKCFPDDSAAIMSLVYFIVEKGLPLSRSEFWSVSHAHPFDGAMTSQRVSELLAHMTEDGRQQFLALWMKRAQGSGCLCYDITSISSYSKSNEYVRWGYNRDREKLPQINMAVLFGQDSGLPVYYRRLPGNITDVTSLNATLELLDPLHVKCSQIVFDRGFYSADNITELFSKRRHFILAVPTGREWVEGIIDKRYDEIMLPDNCHQTGDDEVLHVATQLHSWDNSNRRCYLHLYYNARRAVAQYEKFCVKLVRCKLELESGETVKENQPTYSRYFIVKETPKRGRKVEYNMTEVAKYKNRYAGFFCILASKEKDPLEVLDIYRRKDTVENCFDDLKNQADMRRIRVHSPNSMDSRLFIQFLALIFVSRIRAVLRSQKPSEVKYLSVREAMEAMETISSITFTGKRKVLRTEAGPIPRMIMEAFGIPIP